MLEKIRKVERVFKHLEKETSKFGKQSGLNCLTNCDLCCRKKDLEANVLEFLPFAYYLVQNNLHEAALDLLETNPEHCINLAKTQVPGQTSGCSNYQYRGLICRLFGSSAIRDKSGHLVVYTCSKIKTAYPEQYKRTNERLNSGLPIPVISDVYSQIYFIDSLMAEDYNPINVSIRKAIEKVAYYFSNKPIRKQKVKVILQSEKEIFMPEQIIYIPDITPELQFLTSRSSGPGGQNVNKVNSKVEVRLDIPNSALLSDDQKAILQTKLSTKISSEGILSVLSQKDRSQLVNKEDAIRKLNLLISKALTPAKRRKSTRPTKSSVEKRLSTKKIKSGIKQNRQRIDE
ncbi:MAG: alternative ribosome rescue aminoacyl-tRNA hydrolase ArfB [Prolixibacteraceae bacterium]